MLVMLLSIGSSPAAPFLTLSGSADATNQAPVAALTVSVSTSVARQVYVYSYESSDPDGTITSHQLNWGDTSSPETATSSWNAKTHTYPSDGTFTITLTVTDNLGATNSTTLPVVALNQVPVALFTVSVSTTRPREVRVTSSASIDPDGSIVLQELTWDDNSPTETTSTYWYEKSHTYQTDGVFKITLMLTDNLGATNSTTRSATVTGPAAAPPDNGTSTPSDFLVTISPNNVFVGESNIVTVTVMTTSTGAPVGGAEVTLTGGFGSAITDAGGRATFTILPSGSARIDVLVNGDPAGSFTPVGGLTITFNKSTYNSGDTVKVTVIQRGTTAGFVSGATVTVDGVVAGTTGNDGTLTFTALAAGNYTVNASKATFVGASKTLTVVTPVGPAAFTVTTLEVPATANLGETVLVSAIVTNTGGQAGTFTCDLKVDGTTVDSKDVTVNAGSSKQCTFQLVTTKEGALAVTISTASAKTMTVSKPTASFTYSGLTLSKTEVDAGAVVAVSSKVKNTGTASGTSSVALKVNGVTKQTQFVTLGAGEETSVGFELQVGEKGNYSVTVGDQASVTLTVKTVGKAPAPGFEALGAIGAIGTAIVLSERRRKQS
ncbi:MAG: hypothetical protein HY556_08105 [Euryarchaeota archaeon]|nr:hypothetical protein [Euryarchaeota archaeon]